MLITIRFFNTHIPYIMKGFHLLSGFTQLCQEFNLIYIIFQNERIRKGEWTKMQNQLLQQKTILIYGYGGNDSALQKE